MAASVDQEAKRVQIIRKNYVVFAMKNLFLCGVCIEETPLYCPELTCRTEKFQRMHAEHNIICNILYWAPYKFFMTLPSQSWHLYSFYTGYLVVSPQWKAKSWLYSKHIRAVSLGNN